MEDCFLCDLGTVSGVISTALCVCVHMTACISLHFLTIHHVCAHKRMLSHYIFLLYNMCARAHENMYLTDIFLLYTMCVHMSMYLITFLTVPCVCTWEHVSQYISYCTLYVCTREHVSQYIFLLYTVCMHTRACISLYFLIVHRECVHTRTCISVHFLKVRHNMHRKQIIQIQTIILAVVMLTGPHAAMKTKHWKIILLCAILLQFDFKTSLSDFKNTSHLF